MRTFYNVRVLFILLAFAVLGMLGCTERLMTPNISTYGGELDSLVSLISLIVIPIGGLAIATIIYFMLRYKKKDGNRALYLKTGDDEDKVGDTVIKNPTGRKLLKVLLTLDIITIVLDIFIIYHTIGAWNHIEGSIEKKATGWVLPGTADGNVLREDEVLEIKVVLRQFDFDFYYPGKDGIINTRDDFKVSHFMHVPANKKVVIHISAPINGVIHSIFIKSLRLKQDAIPGRTITKWFQIDKSKVDALGNVNWDNEILFDKKTRRSYSKLERGVVIKRKLMASTSSAEKRQDLLKELKEGRAKIQTFYDEFGLEKRFHEIACTEICGPDHSVMNAWMIVDTKEQFAKWYESNSK